MKLPFISYFSEFPAGGDSDDLIVERIILVHKVLEDLVHNGFLLFCNLDGYPLRDDDGDAASDDVVARLLLAYFCNQCVLDKGIEVDLIVENIGSETDGGVNGVLEKNIFVVRCCRMLAKMSRIEL